MANIPQNDTYGTQTGPSVPSGSTYNPRPIADTYANLARIRQSGGIFNPTPTPMPGTPEDFQARQAGILQYGTLVNNGQGIPTQTQFLPPEGNPRTPIPLPSDYGNFAAPMSINSNGQNLSWGTPVNPVIMNLSGDTPGQYVQDLAAPDKLVKTERGYNPVADRAIRAGRPGSLYQVDHIIPLALGGADTLANRQLLTYEQNDKKTRAQAVPYTLYAYGKISLDQARAMAMQWKDRDLSDIPQPNNVGLIDLKLAEEAAQRWTQPKPVGFKDVMKAMPGAAKDLGKGFLPDPIREFIKGVASGVTMNFVPYEQGENQGLTSKVAGIGGQILGTLAPWALATKIIFAPFALARGGSLLLGSKKALAVSQAAANGFGAAEKIASSIKTLNSAPGYVSKFLSNPELIKQMAKFGATSAVFGQGSQFVANKFNPYTLSGEMTEQEQEGMMGNIFKDLSIGAVTGVASPTLKGTAYAAITPMALSFWADPDDPVAALTNGVMFGVMHAASTYKNPGYNNVEMLGGKPYENPVIKGYNHVMDHAAYQSLSFYNPKLMPEVRVSEPVPKLTPETIETAKNEAINNVWQRFFFQKESDSRTQKTTLNRFKEYSRDINTRLDNQKQPVELGVFSKLSMSARRAANTENKAQNEAIKSEFGPGAEAKVPENMPDLPETGLDLQAALTEIKRITIAARQLYKGTLSAEMRNQADIDDLLSFGKMIKDREKSNLQNRFESQIRFAGSEDPVVVSPKAKQAVEKLLSSDPEFMSKSTRIEDVEPTGKYPTGTIAATGAAYSRANIKKAEYFFEQKANGNASPNVLLVRRPDLAPLFSMSNKLLTPEQIKAGDYAIDPKPGNAIQVFGVVKNPDKGGAVELVELGMVASDHRLNNATAAGHRAFNQHPLVKKWIETNGAEGMEPITPSNHKDTIAESMDRNKVDILVGTLDPRATIKTIESGNPFIPVRVSDANWLRSQQLKSMIKPTGEANPLVEDIARINSAIGAREMTERIQAIKDNPERVKPASEYIPKQESLFSSTDIEVNRALVPQETTRTVVQTIERAIDVADPAQLKEAFQRNFNLILTDEQAAQIFVRRNEMTMKEGIQLLVNAANEGKTDAQTRIALEFVANYVNSGALSASPAGKATIEMPILGKKEPIIARGVEEHLPTQQAEVTTQPTEPVVNNTSRIVAEPLPEGTTPVKSAGLLDRIMAASKEVDSGDPSTFPTLKEALKTKILSPKLDKAEETSRSIVDLETRGAFKMDDGQPHFANKDNLTPEEFVLYKWEKMKKEDPATVQFMLGNPKDWEQMKTVRELRKKTIEDMVLDMPENFPGMELDQALVIVGRTLPEISGMTNDYVGQARTLPGSKKGEYSKFIERGLKTSPVEQPQVHYFAKAFNKGLEDMLGKDYKKIPGITGLLDDYFKMMTSKELNAYGKEITQPYEVLDYRAQGDFVKEKNAYRERNKKNDESREITTGNSLSKQDLNDLGILPDEVDTGFYGMYVKPKHQDENIAHDLTAFEDLAGGLFAPNAKSTGAEAVEVVKDIFMGDKNNKGLREYIISRVPTAKKSVSLDKLIDEAKKTDEKAIEVRNTKAAETEKASQMLPVLKNQLEEINKAIADPEGRANWQTDELLYDNLNEITQQIAKYSSLLEKGKPKDGGGGPGFKKYSKLSEAVKKY